MIVCRFQLSVVCAAPPGGAMHCRVPIATRGGHCGELGAPVYPRLGRKADKETHRLLCNGPRSGELCVSP